MFSFHYAICVLSLIKEEKAYQLTSLNQDEFSAFQCLSPPLRLSLCSLVLKTNSIYVYFIVFYGQYVTPK